MSTLGGSFVSPNLLIAPASAVKHPFCLDPSRGELDPLWWTPKRLGGHRPGLVREGEVPADLLARLAEDSPQNPHTAAKASNGKAPGTE